MSTPSDRTDSAQADRTDSAPDPLSGVSRGPLVEGERVTLTDTKGRRHSVVLKADTQFHTTKGGVDHNAMIGHPEGIVVTSVNGLEFLVMRPLLAEFTVTMPRGAAVVYPKDAAQIVMGADIFPGARVIEAGVGSGALSMSLLRAIGPTGWLHSYERRADFAEIAQRNVGNFFGAEPQNWQVHLGDLAVDITDDPVDRVILDMLAPWECVDAVADVLVPGGMVCAYVATTTQLGRFVETLRAHTGFTEPEANEHMVRGWHAVGMAIRPNHAGIGHTGFLVTARRLAPGTVAPARKRRPAPGAYGPDYHGPRPPGVEESAAAQ